ncbi:MAG: 3-hydroxyacyl-CoA dehydrogenase family protein [Spirochaetes bacterium]|nr:MAG: 3-hydroxyacyl-CoA dehydrogenase family protein [Spirochaetota bacterium]
MKTEDIKTIAVIGAGDMGHGIAQLCASAGFKVCLYDIKQEFVDRGIRKIRDSLAKQVAKKRMDESDLERVMSAILGFTSLKDAVRDIDYMIEAVPEILDLKQKVFREIDEYAPPHAILASNTSNMNITGMGAATRRPEKVLGVHFFNPVAMMALVEVIRGAHTTEETMRVSYDLVSGLKNLKGPMVPVRVEKDTPGFIFNRVNAPVGLFLSELYDRGLVVPEAVDARLRALGAPMGPYELMDYTGLDVNLHGMEYFGTTLSPEFKPGGWLKSLIQSGMLGKKSGKGIFAWPGGDRPAIDLSKADRDFDPMDLVCLQVNEGTKLLEAGVASSAAEIDKALINGGGSVIGPFALAGGMGWEKVAARCEAISQWIGLKWFMPTEMLKNGDLKI